MDEHDPSDDADRTAPAHAESAPSVQQSETVVLTVGDIGVSPHWVVTPNGTAPLAGTTWIARDQTRTESKIANWALVTGIIVAIFTCGLGLLFLLVKEKTTTGYVEVTVQGERLFHATQIPVASEFDVARVRQQVSQAQSLVARVSR